MVLFQLMFCSCSTGDAGCHYLKRKKQKENCKSVLIARLLSDQCILDSMEVYKKEPVKTPSLSCTVNIYYFLATENSGYFKLFSKTNQGLNKKRTIHTFSSLKRKEDLRSTPCNWHELISGSCNWLLSSQLENENFRSLIGPDKCVRSTLNQSERLYCSRHKNDVVPQLANVEITAGRNDNIISLQS